MTRKLSKKNRNVITGILIGALSLIAVINFAEVPGDEVREFLFATMIFFAGIIVLALIAVVCFKSVLWMGRRLTKQAHEQNDVSAAEAIQDAEEAEAGAAEAVSGKDRE